MRGSGVPGGSVARRSIGPSIIDRSPGCLGGGTGVVGMPGRGAARSAGQATGEQGQVMMEAGPFVS